MVTISIFLIVKAKKRAKTRKEAFIKDLDDRFARQEAASAVLLYGDEANNEKYP